MKILITGASGFIGLAITRGLLDTGHAIVGCVRNPIKYKRSFPEVEWLQCDFLNDNSVPIWKKRLRDIDIVINCVGILFHPKKEVTWKIHYFTPRALFEAAFEMKVKKIIHISALNSERYNTEYAKSKKAAEDYLKSIDIPSVILKPSLVYGYLSLGSFMLFKRLACLPFIISVPGTGDQKFQPIHISDLTRAVIHMLTQPIQHNITLAAVSSFPVSLTKMVCIIREWLALKSGIVIHVPLFLIKLVAFFGNFVPFSMINSEAVHMLSQNNIATQKEHADFVAQVNFTPKDFFTGVNLRPSTIFDKWTTYLLMIKPMLRLSVAFVWLMSAVTSSLIFPLGKSYQLLAEIGIHGFWQPIILYGASLLNALIGLALLFNLKTSINCLIQIIVILLYTVIITFKLPFLWAEPFGSIAKNIPLLVSIVILFILERK